MSGWRAWLRARRGRLLAVFGGVGAIVLAAFAVDAQRFLASPLELPEEGLEFVVPPGSSVGQLAARLAGQGVLRSPLTFELYARLQGLAPRIKAGEYRIVAGTSPLVLLEQLTAGRVALFDLTLVEGWTFRQARAAVQAHPKLRTTLAGLDDAALMAKLGHVDEAPEGRFFPDTYRFAAGTTDAEFLERAYRTMRQKLDEIWARRKPELPLATPYEALILASIIEKETAVPEERRRIAGVFVRRLLRGMPLQTDPTVIYGLGERYEGTLRTADLRSDGPYNTYTRKGLPPTPIALPGLPALEAAVAPLPGDELYFVARGDGGHVFSVTLDEHTRRVREYLQHRRSEDESRQ